MAPPPATLAFIPGLDGLRAVSILIVFVAHAGLGHIVPGGFGVTVFFFLSGYLITTLLIRENDAHGRIAIPAFYMRRVVRLMPPLLVTLGFAGSAVLLGYAEGDLDPKTLFSQVFFFFNYYALYGESGTTVAGLSILWSLSVEEQFYLLFPVCFILLTGRHWRIPGIALAIVAVLVWRIVRFEVLGHAEWELYISTDTRIDSILYGCLLAVIGARRPDDLRFISRWPLPVLGLSLAILLASFLIRDPAFRSTLRYTLQGLALMPIFHLAVTQPRSPLFAWLNWRPVRRLGQYSYTFYLAHFVIIKMLVLNGIAADNLALLLPVSFVLTTLYSGLVFRFIEKPLQPLRSRLTGHA